MRTLNDYFLTSAIPDVSASSSTFVNVPDGGRIIKIFAHNKATTAACGVQNGCRFINIARISINFGWEEPHRADTASASSAQRECADDAQQYRRVLTNEVWLGRGALASSAVRTKASVSSTIIRDELEGNQKSPRS